MSSAGNGVTLVITAQPRMRNHSTPNFPLAAQPDMVRAAQKDEYYGHGMHAQIREAAIFLLGNRRFIKYEQEIRMLGDLAYYSLTTLVGQQTLGEEYCDLTQVIMLQQQQQQQQQPLVPATTLSSSSTLPSVVPTPTPSHSTLPAPHSTSLSTPSHSTSLSSAAPTLPPPHSTLPTLQQLSSLLSGLRELSTVGNTHYTRLSIAQRCNLLFLRVVAPYILDRVLPQLLLRYSHHYSGQLTSERIRAITESMRWAVQFAVRFNLGVFYMSGYYLELSKRFARTLYVFTGKVDEANQRPSYQFLGVLILLQQGITALQVVYRWYRELYSSSSMGTAASAATMASEVHDEEQEDRQLESNSSNNDVEDARFNCALCLTRRRHTTATPCGHLFCWTCITECCANQGKCPLCRSPITMPSLARVYHYDRVLKPLQ